MYLLYRIHVTAHITPEAEVLVQNFILNQIYHAKIGIKHDFPFINIRYVPRGMLKTEGVALLLKNRRLSVLALKLM